VCCLDAVLLVLGKGWRREYLLTQAGAHLGEPAAALTELLQELDATDIGLKKWSLPVLTLLTDERRFSELRATSLTRPT